MDRYGDAATAEAVVAEAVGTEGPFEAALTAATALDRAEAEFCHRLTVLGRESDRRARLEGGGVELERRSLCLEIGAATGHGEYRVRSLLELGDTLHALTPATFAAWRAGRICRGRARVIGDAAATLRADAHDSNVHDLTPETLAEAVARLEADLLPYAHAHTTAQTARRARLLLARHRQDRMPRKHREAAEQRALFFEPAADGMAYLTHYLPAEHATAILDRTRRIAKHLQTQEAARLPKACRRTLQQLQSDVATDLLTAGTISKDAGAGDSGASWPNVKAHITVTVPALTLIGHTNEPADLEGYGPIDADTARALAGGSPFWHRMLTHPHSGIPLAYDRATYRPPADLAQWIKHRDTTCRAPGCTIPASRCDIDHTVAWQHGGGTNADNLANLCRRHDTLKHHTGWTPTNHGDGRLTWTSPHRQRHAVAPEPTAANTDLPPPF